MILANVNIGSGPSAGDGDPLRTAFNIINNNFAQLQINVNALSNSVTSVAGRRGNVVLTVQDIIGIDSVHSSLVNGNALVTLGSNGVLSMPGGMVVGTNAAVASNSVESAAHLDLTKQVHKLATGYHFIPDGSEGQIIYLVPQTGARKDYETYLVFANVRYWNGSNASIGSYNLQTGSWGYGAFHDNATGLPSLTTLIYTDGAWNVGSGPAID
jgi:hypothetical protein